MKAKQPYWAAPRLWEGETCAVLASGAGMSPEVASLVKASGIRSIAINNTFRLAPFADVLYAAYSDWCTNSSNDDVKKFAGLKVSVSDVPSSLGVFRMQNTGPSGFDPCPTNLRTGRNSGYQAVHLAVHLGAKRILLCGYNLTGPNWHGKHVNRLRSTEEAHYELFRKSYPTLVDPLKALGVEVLNCTPGSALTCFPTSTLEQALCLVPST